MKNSFLKTRKGLVIGLCIMSLVITSCCGHQAELKEIHEENLYKNFSKADWVKEPTKRIYMYDDLIQEHDFYSMSKADILQLLGNEYCTISSDGNIIYYMGEKPDGWFSYNLYIRFNEKDMVTNFELYQD